eukprot:3122410-Rhodomonas_salina.1
MFGAFAGYLPMRRPVLTQREQVLAGGVSVGRGELCDAAGNEGALCRLRVKRQSGSWQSEEAKWPLENLKGRSDAWESEGAQ